MSKLSDFLDRYSLYLALLTAWVATLGSLYFSWVAGYVPCELCWYQRILMYPLTLILAVGLWRSDENLTWLILPFSLFGLGIAGYHNLLEKTDLFPAHACTAGVSCTTLWINWFGFITIPFLSLTAFTLITVFTWIAHQAGEPVNDPDSAPLRWPVTVVVGAGVIVYALLWVMGANRTAQAASAMPVLAVAQPSNASGTAAASDPTGFSLYQEACAACHGAQGEGLAGLGLALAASEVVRTHDDQFLLALIRTGLAVDHPYNNNGQVAMPPSGGRPDLNDEQLLAVVRIMRAFAQQAQ
jgi:disulfide bond formation protein DsbB